MAQLPLVLFFNPATTDYVRVIARPRSNMGTVAADEVFAPPHPNPRVTSIYVPSPETHEVSIYKSPDGVALGIKVSGYDAMPVYYNSVFLADLDLVTGRNSKEDPGQPGKIIDPVASQTEVEIPYLAGKTVARIYRDSRTRFMRDDEYALTTAGGQPGLRLLTEGDTFYAGELGGEGFRIEFGPYYENNTGQAIFDLTKQIAEHIADTDNPHEVDKADVGLGNLPNAVTNSYQENDPAKLASAQAVYNLWQASIDAKILAVRSVFVGNIGAISVGGEISAVNNVGPDSRIVITHNLNIAGNYRVWPVLEGRSTGTSGGFDNWNNDNDVVMVVGNAYTSNSFELFLRKLGSNTTSVVVHYMLIKTT